MQTSRISLKIKDDSWLAGPIYPEIIQNIFPIFLAKKIPTTCKYARANFMHKIHKLITTQLFFWGNSKNTDIGWDFQWNLRGIILLLSSKLYLQKLGTLQLITRTIYFLTVRKTSTRRNTGLVSPLTREQTVDFFSSRVMGWILSLVHVRKWHDKSWSRPASYWEFLGEKSSSARPRILRKLSIKIG